MRHADVVEAIDYLYWMRDRIVAAATSLSDTEFRRDEPTATRSLRATLAHQVECEWAWRVRLSEGAFPEGDVIPDEFPTLGALLDRWRHEERALRAWLAVATEAELEALPPGPGNTLARWRYLLYIVNHGTQQFSEAAVLLSAAGHSPGEIGYLAFCLERAGAG